MKRRVFVGPSLSGVVYRPAGIEFHPPAARGDITRAVVSGVQWIGLIDGYFGSCASVWHKEILFALAEGCHVWGAASMGALRAAECQAFGMRPVGVIARQFATGSLYDDAEVAILHGPAEADYVPLTEALVDVRATVQAMVASGVVPDSAAADILGIARGLHFTERTLDVLMARVTTVYRGRPPGIEDAYHLHRTSAKKMDALQIICEMASTMPRRLEVEAWQISQSASLRSLMDSKNERRQSI